MKLTLPFIWTPCAPGGPNLFQVAFSEKLEDESVGKNPVEVWKFLPFLQGLSGHTHNNKRLSQSYRVRTSILQPSFDDVVELDWIEPRPSFFKSQYLIHTEGSQPTMELQVENRRLSESASIRIRRGAKL